MVHKELTCKALDRSATANFCRIYSGNEISQIFFIVFLPFVGRVKKRPLFMSLSAVLAAVGLFIIALPHFTGDQNYLVSRAVTAAQR